MFNSLLDLDVRTLIAVLFFGNLVSVALLCIYYATVGDSRDRRISGRYLPAKACQAVGYFLLLQRDAFPTLLSVNLGNSLLMLGFYLEALAMLAAIRENGRVERVLGVILVACVVGFNATESAFPDSSMRVAISSLCVFLILFMPNIRMLVSGNATRLKRWTGFFYLCFVAMLLPRMVCALFTPMSLLTNSVIQTLTFLALVVLLVFSLPAYLFLMKERSDMLMAAMATTDFLTGLSNRYSFLDIASRVFLRHRIDRKSLAVLFFDIDYFKSVNDRYGHAFGDAVLAALGKVVRDNLRPFDLSCRYGGEEFVVLLSDATKATAVMVAERIRAAVAALSFAENPDFSFTISFGVADGRAAEGDSLDLYIGQADGALGMAKKGGRNQIVEYDPVKRFIGGMDD